MSKFRVGNRVTVLPSELHSYGNRVGTIKSYNRNDEYPHQVRFSKKSYDFSYFKPEELEFNKHEIVKSIIKDL